MSMITFLFGILLLFPNIINTTEEIETGFKLIIENTIKGNLVQEIIYDSNNIKLYNRNNADSCMKFKYPINHSNSLEIKVKQYSDGSFNYSKLKIDSNQIEKKFSDNMITLNLTKECKDNEYSYVNIYYDNTEIFNLSVICDNYNKEKYKFYIFLNQILFFFLITVLMYYSTKKPIIIKENNETNQNNQITYKEILKMIIYSSSLLILLFFYDNYVTIIFSFLIGSVCYFSLINCIQEFNDYTSSRISIKINGLTFNKVLLISADSSSRFKFKLAFKNINDVQSDDVSIGLFDILTNITSVIVMIYYFSNKNYIINGILAICLAYTSIPNFFEFNTYSLVYVFMLSFCLFDVFWVYFSPFIFHTNVMILAVQKLDFPIKILFPCLIDIPTMNCITLGLGDIIIPSVVIIFSKRFSFLMRDNSYYYFSLICYFFSLTITGLNNLIFEYPQPAILYMFGFMTNLVVVYAYLKGNNVFNLKSLESKTIKFFILNPRQSRTIYLHEFSTYMKKEDKEFVEINNEEPNA